MAQFDPDSNSDSEDQAIHERRSKHKSGNILHDARTTATLLSYASQPHKKAKVTTVVCESSSPVVPETTIPISTPPITPSPTVPVSTPFSEMGADLNALLNVPRQPAHAEASSSSQNSENENVVGEEGEIRFDDRELIRVYDPMTLINFSEQDLRILDSRTLMYHDAWGKSVAEQFEKIVRVCVKHGIDAGSLLPSKWK
ncbi:hypothetical protein L1987_57874 [Smallanthus sonchifolius]|uniref:Uncharacterized protein n=1 Tax=Smallanthus sonchifolius TaxID=185202 RepID=A0ACB9DE01_9ASTR|nr:hypothetical protein L1987_57874 [Smallanthus sonchifolius]